MRRLLVLAAAALSFPLAGLAHADPITVTGCSSLAQTCAFDTITVNVDTDPIEESHNCAYGPSIVVDSPSVEATGVGGSLVGPYYLKYTGPGYDSGPLWTIPC